MKFLDKVAWIFSGLMLAASSVYAQNSITALNASDSGNGTTIVKVEFAQPLVSLPAGAGVTINNPDTMPRIVLDFYDTSNGIGKSDQEFNKGSLRSVKITQAGKGVRMEFNLDRMLPYTTKADGKNLLIVLEGNTARPSVGGSPPQAMGNSPETKIQAKNPETPFAQPELIPAKKLPGAWVASAGEIRSLLEQNKPQDAYQLGRSSPHMFGDPSFDFFYGIAAIEAGHAGEGVLALERYILSYPDNRDARFQLARGYFILGEDQRARDEFEALLPGSAGEQKVAVERHLDAIRSRESRYQPTAKTYVEAGVGVDTNINAGLNSGATPLIPGLGFLPAVSPSSITAREQDTFLTVSAGGQGTYPVSPGISLYATGGIDVRRHLRRLNDMFDQHSLGANGGVSYLVGMNLFKAGASISQSWVDNQSYVLSYGLNGEWNHQLDQFNRLTLGAQVARFNYDDMNVYLTKDKTGGRVFSQGAHKNSDLAGVSGAWTHALAVPFQPIVTVSASYGEDRSQRNRDDLSRDIYGGRISFAMTPAEHWGINAGLSYQENKHRAAFTTGSVSRRDTSWSLDGSLSYFYTRDFSVRTEVQAMDQNSNIGLFQYRREALSVKARYDF